MTSARRALAGAARCERPRRVESRAPRDQPGRLVVGPDPKRGFPGRSDGFMRSTTEAGVRWRTRGVSLRRASERRERFQNGAAGIAFPSMISVSNLAKEYGDRTLFAGATFQLNPGERYAL